MRMLQRMRFQQHSFNVGCFLLLNTIRLTHESTLQQQNSVSITTTFTLPPPQALNSSDVDSNSTTASSISLPLNTSSGTEVNATSPGNASVTTTIPSNSSSSSSTSPKDSAIAVYQLPTVVRDLGWVVALITLSSAGIVLVLAFEIWILIKTLTVPAAMRMQSMWLGQVLLFSIFCSYLTLYAFLPFSSPVTCGIIRFCVGVCYALCFAVLLLKLLLILGSRSLGYEVPIGFQATLLFFIWTVQLVIDIQWLITTPPKTIPVLHQRQGIDVEPWGSCDPDFAPHVQSLVYVMFLIVLCAILALGTHGSRTNHREGLFIGLASGVTIAFWIVWILCGFLMNDPSWHEPCIAFGLLATVTWILLIMFIPKLYHLHKMTASDPLAEYYGRTGTFPRNVFDGPAALTPENRRVASRREEESFSASMRFGAEMSNGSNVRPSGSRPNEYSSNLSKTEDDSDFALNSSQSYCGGQYGRPGRPADEWAHRQTNRQIDKQTDIHIARQKIDRQIDRQTNRLTSRRPRQASR